MANDKTESPSLFGISNEPWGNRDLPQTVTAEEILASIRRMAEMPAPEPYTFIPPAWLKHAK